MLTNSGRLRKRKMHWELSGRPKRRNPKRQGGAGLNIFQPGKYPVGRLHPQSPTRF